MKTQLLNRIVLICLCATIGLVNIIYAQTNPMLVSSSYYGTGYNGDGNFNAIIFGNHVATHGDTEGRLAVGGNFTFNQPVPQAGYSVGRGNASQVGSPDAAPNGTDNFIVNGTLTNNILPEAQGWQGAWDVYGVSVYKSFVGKALQNKIWPSGAPLSPGVKSGVTNHLDFAGLQNYYKSVTNFLKSYGDTPSGTVTNNHTPIANFPGFGSMTFTGTDPTLNVFSVTAGRTIQGPININVPASSTVIINILDANVDMGQGQTMVNGVEVASSSTAYGIGTKIIFNFPNATTYSNFGRGIPGSVLAPYLTTSNLSGGSINGHAILGGNLTQTGGFEFHNFPFSGSIDISSLPVKLISFNVVTENIATSLVWSTSEEVNTDYFEVQRSKNGKDWKEIGNVAAARDSYVRKNYSFVDPNPGAAVTYYRLRMVDQDGSFAYSDIKNIKLDVVASYVYPNPAVGSDLNIASSVELEKVEIMNVLGQAIQSHKGNTSLLNIGYLKAGNYWVRMTDITGTITTKQFTVLR